MAKADLSWDKPTHRSDGTRVTAGGLSYDLERKPSGGSYTALPSFTQGNTDTREDNNIPDLYADETYTYRIRAREGQGNFSYEPSDWVETELEVPGDTSIVAVLHNTFHINAQGNIDSDETADLEADASGTWDTISYAWSITKGGGTIKGDGDTAVYTPASGLTGTANVTVKCVATARGTGTKARNGTSATQEDTEDFNVRVTPTVSYSPDPPVAGEDVTASFSSNVGINFQSYQWQHRRRNNAFIHDREGATSLTWSVPEDLAGSQIRLRYKMIGVGMNDPDLLNRFFYSDWVTVAEATVIPPPPVLTDAVAPTVGISTAGNENVIGSGATLALSGVFQGGTYDELHYSWSVAGSGTGTLAKNGANATYRAPTVTVRTTVLVTLEVRADGTGTNAKSGTSATASSTIGIAVLPPDAEQIVAVTYSSDEPLQGDQVTATLPSGARSIQWQSQRSGSSTWENNFVDGYNTKTITLDNFQRVGQVFRITWTRNNIKHFASNHVTVAAYTPRALTVNDAPTNLTVGWGPDRDGDNDFELWFDTPQDRGRGLATDFQIEVTGTEFGFSQTPKDYNTGWGVGSGETIYDLFYDPDAILFTGPPSRFRVRANGGGVTTAWSEWSEIDPGWGGEWPDTSAGSDVGKPTFSWGGGFSNTQGTNERASQFLDPGESFSGATVTVDESTATAKAQRFFYYHNLQGPGLGSSLTVVETMSDSHAFPTITNPASNTLEARATYGVYLENLASSYGDDPR